MAETTDGAGALIETIDDLGEGDAAVVQYWLDQDKIAEREDRQWIKDARKIVRCCRAETGSTERNHRRGKRLNLFWSNVQTLATLIYAREPKADVERRFRDDDPVARLATELLERSPDYYLSLFDVLMTASPRRWPTSRIDIVLSLPYVMSICGTSMTAASRCLMVTRRWA